MKAIAGPTERSQDTCSEESKFLNPPEPGNTRLLTLTEYSKRWRKTMLERYFGMHIQRFEGEIQGYEDLYLGYWQSIAISKS